MDGRQHRGMQIAAGGGVVSKGHLWLVPSQSGRGRYKVNPWAGECSCPDYEATNLRCKHLWAATFTMTAEVHADGSSTVTARMTYSQSWSAYNTAQVEEKDRFMTLLAELCGQVPQPPQTRGRPRLPLSDMAFAAAFKVFSRFSSRRFSSDLREAQERGLIVRAPHFNSVTNYLSDPKLTPILHDLITVSSLPLKAIETDFAVDSSGFSTNRFAQWAEFKYGQTERAKSRQWIKAHLMVGVTTNIVTSVEVTAWNEADTRHFGPLVQATASNFQIGDVSADKAYLSKRNLALVEQVGGTPYIPFKARNVPMLPWEDTAWARMYHRFAYEREDFLRRYHKRSNVESAFSMIKAKFGDSIMSKSRTGQMNEVLCKVLAHNVVVVVGAIHEFGIEPAWAPANAPAS
jgi:transposase